MKTTSLTGLRKTFRRRFRVPFQLFEILVRIRGDNNLFAITNLSRVKIPMKIKLLCCLRVLGRDDCCDAIEEYSAVPEKTIWCFFKIFLKNFPRVLFKDVIKLPKEGEELEKVMNVVRWVSLEQSEVLMRPTEDGIYAQWSLSMPRLEMKSILPLRKRQIYENVTYKIIDVLGETKTVTGVYVIFDGGYMKDSFLTDPYTLRSSRSVTYWSEWLESLRRDVECLFGIMKSRFRILRNPVSFHTIIMSCCCILHNLLLSVDGIDTSWEDDVAWDALNPDADLDGDEMVVPVPPVVVDVIPGVAIPLVQDMPVICQISSICMRKYNRKKQIFYNHFLDWHNGGLLC
jgi:Plant transposon protein